MTVPFSGGVQPTIIYTLSKKEADEIGAALRVSRRNSFPHGWAYSLRPSSAHG